MATIIKNTSVLFGKELTFIKNVTIEISDNGIIKKVLKHDENKEFWKNDGENIKILNGERFLILPGFINSHVHIGDSIAKDIGMNLGFNEKINPKYGLKKMILERTNKEHLKTFIKNSSIEMLRKGICTFVDFRENGVDGINLMKESIKDIPIKSIILGRVEQYFDINNKSMNKLQEVNKKELDKLIHIADGIGLSGANENTKRVLIQYKKTFEKIKTKKGNKKLLAVHAAESKESMEYSIRFTKKTEVERVIHFLKPDLIVHMTNANIKDIKLVAKNKIGVILCPRANGVLGVGIPKVSKMLKEGCKIALGSDNIMLNSPDMLKEMDYLWKVSHANEEEQIDPKEILKMVTVNGAELLKLNSGYIEEGREADLLFLDKNHINLQPIHNIYSSIVHRANYDSIKSIMINGKFFSGVL